MGSLWIGVIGLWELFLSTAVHLVFGLYIFSAGVASISRSSHRPARTSDGGSIPPIVLVHGIFGFGKGRLGSLSYFGGAEKKDDRVLVPDLGSLTSVHDRARELFYYLKGGRVDFGEEHSRACGHRRFGRVYEQGHYPEWDEHHPAHFVGHSAGVQVVRVLQKMLADKAFEGYESTSEDWVLSVTSLSGALNGTTRTYMDGMMPEDWKSVKLVSLLQLCRLGCIVYEWLDLQWMKKYYSFGFDHFGMAWREGGVGRSSTACWATSARALQLNAGLRTFPNTFYFSYATKRTRKFLGLTLPSTVLGIHPLLFIRTLQMTQWRHPPAAPPPTRAIDWEDNDGALNTLSMTHPRLPVEHPSHFVVDDSECHPLQPGIWYYKILEADHIFFVLNRDRAGVQFDLMYDTIFQRCRKHAFRTAPPPTLPNHVPH
ncbi:unnamed protein product [Spirodela intermedia]|uniref:Lipase-like C-terminal domain-containing protein n=1 Tax=Spirodela intermedia TaxID=51605 RepID=A0A7I8I9V5_SPIIN|nr:unnamed protein product [Spirodela intermedia]CAA6654193.1 unnamed protein product [Spirodela intermedia]